ncbi:ShlB/FhaC/HecB family hemolysin secretion/activation protein [uncultured Sphingosinicella sp.]|uniref:ShlB/FhaC/HecB family hemolysin secretion/activation protein n=1 Tax=uncultured Sphingosinicella sp. TaxID=478748 RepID=UPI0030DAB235|tara:strand:+ start:1246 stop:2904 length:1659 start_codon:yes stop_codon:yes gene_type:complete
MFKPSLVACALLATTQIVHAQQLPSAGTQLQQLPQPPAAERASPDLVVPRTGAPTPIAGGASVQVQSLRVTGQTQFSESELVSASGFSPGAALTFSQLRELAARIMEHYHARGYILAQAYLPEQDVQDGAVTITVMEGRYGKVVLNNSARLADRVPARLLDGLAAEDLVANAALERRLLLLSDIPGVRVKATLAPGEALGTSDLLVDVAPGPKLSGNLEADNAGNRYTGTYRFGGTLNVNNPAGIGDLLSLRLLASDGGLAYGRVSYQAPVGAVTLGAAYAHLRYSLGREFNALDGSGTADIFSGYASYPLIRSRRANLYALAGVDYKMLRDRIDLFATDSDKRITAGTLGLSGDVRDSIGGSNVFSVGWTMGHLKIRSPAERFADAANARSAGGFNKLQASFARAQQVAGPFSLYGAVRGQYAFDNLDSSEKMGLGGAYGVRAYPEGEAFGDIGYLATAEARLLLGGQRGSLPGQFELFGFVDTGEVRYAKNPWFAGPNSTRRSAYGAGASWAGPHGLILKGTYARKLGTRPATSARDRGGRFWFQIVKIF